MSSSAERAMRVMENAGAAIDQPPATRKDAFQVFQQRVEDMLPMVAKYLPQMVDPHTLVGVVMLNVRRTPELLDCSMDSLLAAALQGIQLNLPPGPFGLSYMVPFNNKVGDNEWRKEVQFIVGYKGYLETARNSGQMDVAYAFPVFEGDEFYVVRGADANNPPRIHHIENQDVDRSDPKGITHVYAAYWAKGSSMPQFDVMSRAEVERVRKSGKSGNSPAWRDWWDAMAMAKVVRRLANRGGMPVTEQMIRVLDADESVRSSFLDDVQPLQPASFTVPQIPQTVEPVQPEPGPEPEGTQPDPTPEHEAEPQPDREPEPEGSQDVKYTYCMDCGTQETLPAKSRRTRCKQCDAPLVVAGNEDDLRKAVAKALEPAADDGGESQQSLPVE